MLFEVTKKNDATTAYRQLPAQISASWQFCDRHQVNPLLIKPSQKLSPTQLAQKRQDYQPLLQLIHSFRNQLVLESKIEDILFVVTDSQGNIIDRRGPQAAQTLADQINFQEGNNWSELAVGTNAIGLALTSKQLTSVILEQHFAAGSKQWSCVAAPIFDSQQRVLAIIDLSAYHCAHIQDLQWYLLTLATKINEQLLRDYTDLLEYAVQKPSDTVICDCRYQVVKIDTPNPWQLTQGANLQPLLQKQIFTNPQKIFCHKRLIGYQYSWPTNLKLVKSANHQVTMTVSYNSAYRALIAQVQQAAHSDLPIHIFGESGSGKEIIAQLIYRTSHLQRQPLIVLNCGALSNDLLISELFGYAPGAFTGASAKGYVGKLKQADGGTLFLDEVESMSLSMQRSLLRVLEDHWVTPLGGQPQKTHFRLITASNQDLKQLVQQKQFRADLFYRIYLLPFHLPPLRERFEDLPLLIENFCEQRSWQLTWQKKIIPIAQKYSWPGNIREFNNFLQRLWVYYSHQEPSSTVIKDLIEVGALNSKTDPLATSPIIASPKTKKPASEAQQLQAALQKNNFNKTQVAEELQISRTTLYRKLKKWGLDA